MPVYRIQVIKTGRKNPHYAVISAPSILSAEYYAIEEMILKPKQLIIKDYYKFGIEPHVESKDRTDFKSIFTFRSNLKQEEEYINFIKIILDNSAHPLIDYNINYDVSIFELFKEIDSIVISKKEIDFFNKEDLEYFSNAVGEQFSSGDSKSQEIKKTLTEKGVFAKTAYWSLCLEKLGYITDFRYDWQHSGRVRYYSWARISLQNYLNPNVFFTIGVGSKEKETGKKESRLIYKLDCRRDKLSREQIKLFDDYVNEFCDGGRREIEANNLKILSWNKLVEATNNFIVEYSEQYRELTKLINDEKSLPVKLARLCWNEDGWQFPSGADGKSKTNAKSFEKEKGYGYEEWFFDTEKQIEGYHYSFLQPFNKGNHEGEKYEIYLYSLKSNKSKIDKYWIAHIKCLEVLTKEEAINILNIYKQKGWYNEMLDQLKAKGIEHFNFGPVAEDYIFNVRYKIDTSNVVIYKPYRPIINFKEEVGSGHYVLLDKQTQEVDLFLPDTFSFREGHNPNSKKGVIRSNYSREFYHKTLRHKEIQEIVYNQLLEEYINTNIKVGTEQPTGLGTLIDLVVYNPKEGYIFYEIKTGSSALGCIREAIGQMLEYCYYPTNNHACKLIIIAPYRIDIEVKKYMKHLRSVLGINLYYQYFSLERNILEDQMA